MPDQISRRSFILSTGALSAGIVSTGVALTAATSTLTMPSILSAAANEVPTLLDHILLGCNDLDHGIAFVERHTGVRAAFGGVHPGRGTRNALLALDGPRYLEIIAPDPQQSDVPDSYGLLRLTEPRVVTWAAHPGNLQPIADRLAKAGVAAEGPTPGSRKRPDGKLLQWKTLNLKDNAAGLLPFLIEWGVGSLHPSADSPKGCRLVRFQALTPNTDALTKAVELLGLDLAIAKGDRPQLQVTIAGSKGDLSLTS